MDFYPDREVSHERSNVLGVMRVNKELILEFSTNRIYR